jgi:hypothetical protein
VSYTVTVVNSSGAPFTTKDGKTINEGETWTSDVLGNAYIHSDEFGSISFRDIGETHIGGDDPKTTWGVLISYGGQHMVGRYEGGGELHVTFNDHLQADVSGMNLRRVRLDALVGPGEAELHAHALTF